MKRLNWKWAATVTLLGIVAIIGGLAIGEFAADSFEALLLEIGSAVGLVAVLVVLERRLETRVAKRAESAANEAVSRATSDLRERVVRLENLDNEQSRERADRRRQIDAKLQDILSGELTVRTVGEILTDGQDEHLFDGGAFRVRTSPEPTAHALYMLPLRDNQSVQMMWLDFEPLVASGEALDVGGRPIAIPKRGPSTVLWTPDDDAAAVASQLEAGLSRRNEPFQGFSLRYALERLARSYQVMWDARAAAADSPLRIHGRLQLLVNEGWAITSHGLESTRTAAAYEVRRAGFQGGGGVAVWRHAFLTLPPNPPADPDLEAALRWVQEREGWELESADPMSTD